jgi:hypothetical protein
MRGEVLTALGIFQRATPDQLWKLTRPHLKHDRATRDTLNDLVERGMVRRELWLPDRRGLWVLTKLGHRDAKERLPKGIRMSRLRDPGQSAGHVEHALAVTQTAAELSGAGLASLGSWQTEVGHRLPGGFVQRADLVMKSAMAAVPVLLVEVDRSSEGADTLMAKLEDYHRWFDLLAPKADAQGAKQAGWCQGPEIHDFRLWRRVYPPTGREGYPPIAFVFADGSKTTVENTTRALETHTRHVWAGRRYTSDGRAVNYHQAVPVVATTLP